MSMSDPDAALRKFCSLFLLAVSANTRIVQCKKIQVSAKPMDDKWSSKKFKEERKHVQKIKRQPFNIRLAKRYKSYCNLLNTLLKQAKRSYCENEFHKNKNNPKKQWQLFNSFLNRSSADACITKIDYNGSTLSEPKEIANAFSDHFSSVYTNRPPPHVQSYIPLGRTAESFFLFPTTPHEVFSMIANLKNTGPGLDEVCVRHLKLVAHLVSDKLCHIINLMLKHGSFPSFLKKS